MLIFKYKTQFLKFIFMKEIKTMSEIFNSRQIVKIHGTNKLLEFNDHLSVNLYQQTEEPAKMKLVPGLHSCYSKIEAAVGRSN